MWGKSCKREAFYFDIVYYYLFYWILCSFMWLVYLCYTMYYVRSMIVVMGVAL